MKTSTLLALAALASSSLFAAVACAPATAPATDAKPVVSVAASPTPTPPYHGAWQRTMTGTPAWTDGELDLADAAAVLAQEEDLTEFRANHPEDRRMARSESIYSNIMVLDTMTAERVMAAMFGMHRALDVRCPFCHDPQNFASDEKAEKKTARQMLFLTQSLNESAFHGETNVTCWTCHRGKEAPDSHPKDLAKKASAIAIPGTLKAPSDPKLLAKDAYKNLEKLGKLPAKSLLPAMQMMAASIGKDCAFCHDPNSFESDEKRAKKIARSMLRLTSRVNAEIFQTADDKDSVTCWTCHRGSLHPEVLPGSSELPRDHEENERRRAEHEHGHDEHHEEHEHHDEPAPVAPK